MTKNEFPCDQSSASELPRQVAQLEVGRLPELPADTRDVLERWIHLHVTQHMYWYRRHYLDTPAMASTFFMAAKNGHTDMCRWLLRTQKEHVFADFLTPSLSRYENIDQFGVCQIMRECGLAVTDNDNLTLYALRGLVWAAKHNRTDLCRLLKDWGLCLIEKDQATHSPNHWKNSDTAGTGVGHITIGARGPACCMSRERYIKNKALRVAAKLGHTDLFQFLKEWGTDLGPSNETHANSESEPNIFAQALNWLGIMPSPAPRKQPAWTLDDVRSDGNGGVLFNAATRGHLGIVRLLREWGIPVSDLRANHYSILRETAQNGHLDIIKYFHEWKDANQPDQPADRLTIDDIRSHDTYLLCAAAKGGHVHVMDFLRNTWELTIADAKSRNNNILYVAARYGHPAVLQYCKEWKAEDGSDGFTTDDVRCPTILQAAAQHGHLEVLRALKETWGLSVYDASDFDNLALQMAARGNHGQACLFLADWVFGPQSFREYSMSPN
jgi:ankyrin repeat protein